MTDNFLSPAMVYECNDTDKDKTPIESIKYVGVTVTPLISLDLLESLVSLEVATFRLCSITKFPEEFFKLPCIKSIDLSGNMIETIPDSEKWSKMEKLISLNISDNNVAELSELFKLKTAPRLRQLNFLGNICQSANNAVNRIVSELPRIDVVNDTIILSQHKAAIQSLAINNKHGIIPLSKTDDFFFNYARFMRSGIMERYSRRFDAEMFCLDNVIRKYSFVEKIQSMFRGYIKRKSYKEMKHAAIVIERQVKKWYKKRVDSANLIKKCYKEMVKRKQIKFERAVKLIQRRWRGKIACEKALEYSFKPNEITEFYITKKNLDILLDFCKEANFAAPKVTHNNKYKVLKTREPMKMNLPGSPLVYYSSDDSLVLKKIQNNEIHKDFSLWRSHIQVPRKENIRVNKFGINKIPEYLFNTVHPSTEKIKVNKVVLKERNDDVLLHCSYDNYKDFIEMFRELRKRNIKDMKLIPEKSAATIAAIVAIQNTVRTMIIRKKMHKEIKQEVLEQRACKIIAHFFRFIRIRSVARTFANIVNFKNNLQKIPFFYTSQKTLEDLEKIKIKSTTRFGFNVDREVVILPEEERNVLTMEIPQEKAIFNEEVCSSLIKVGSNIVNARRSMFDSEWISPKFLEKSKIKKISFPTITEARYRAILITIVLKSTSWYLTEEDIIRLQAATKIKNAWIGHTTRAMLYYISSQLRRPLNTKIFICRSDTEKDKAAGIINVKYDRAKALRDKLDVNEQIAQLRGDYKPWKDVVDDYKKRKAEEEKQNKKLKKNEERESTPQKQLPEESSSKKMIGLIKTFEPEETRPETQLISHYTTPRFELLQPKPKTALANPKLTTTNAVKRLVDFQSTTDHNFAPPILDQALSMQKTTATTTTTKRPQTAMERNATIRPQAKPQIIAKPVKPASALGGNQTFYQAATREKTPRRMGTTKTRQLKPLDEKEAKQMIKETKSPQSSDTAKEEIVKETFTRLAHLIQVTETVVREQVVDNSIEEKREAAVRARTAMTMKRYETMNNNREKNEGMRVRSQLEREERMKTADKVKAKALEQKIIKAKTFRNEHIQKQEKHQKETLFAQKFVSATRQLAQKCESRHLKEASRLQLEATQDASVKVRQADIQKREKFNSEMEENKVRKIQTARLDRELLQQKIDTTRKQHEERLERLSELKTELRETMTAVSKLRERGVQYIMPNMKEPVQLDDIEATANALNTIIGGNLGFEESHLIAEMLYDLL